MIWWVVKLQICSIFTPKIGEDSQFDEHIFQMGWELNHQLGYTPPKTNMEPENGPLERRFLLEAILFRFHVQLREGMFFFCLTNLDFFKQKRVSGKLV